MPDLPQPAPPDKPDDLLELLSGTIRSAARAPFYSKLMTNGVEMRGISDFERLPITPLERYRRQRLADVLAEPSQVDLIVGPYRGQSPEAVAVTEGADEIALRYEIFADTVRDYFPIGPQHTVAVLAAAERRQFAAEVATMLINAGVVTHVFTDYGDGSAYELIRSVDPQVVALLCDEVDESALPPDVEFCITFRRSHVACRTRQLDLYVVDELGLLASSEDCETYWPNDDVYYFERSEKGNLVVTSLYNRVQPMLRIETMDAVKPLIEGAIEFTALSAVP